MNKHSVDDLKKGDDLRNKMLDRVDSWNGPVPLWAGWVIMEAYLAGLEEGRKEEFEKR